MKNHLTAENQKAYLRALPLVACLFLLCSCLDLVKVDEKKGGGGDDAQAGLGTGTTPSDFTVVPDQPGNANNNNDNNISQNQPPLDPNDLAQGGFEGLTINNQALQTKDTSLTLRFFTLSRYQLKLSENTICDGGSWEEFASQKIVSPSQLNKLVRYSVQFMDYDFVISPCFSASIIQDSKAPDIVFSQYPTTVEEGSPVSLIYDVDDTGVGVNEVTCKINDLAKPCTSGRNTVQLPALSVGQYTFTVTATDKLGNESSQSIQWSVTSLYRHLTQLNRVNDFKKVDILFVIDNSGSMSFEQQSMAQRVRNFLSVLQGLDYKIAVTTTDPNQYPNNRGPNLQNGGSTTIGGSTSSSGGATNNAIPAADLRYYGDGEFIPIYNTNDYFLTPATPIEEAQLKLGMTLQRPEIGSGVEQGIRSAYRVVERSLTAGSAAQSFFRDGAQFAVVLISDEDESANTNKNDPQNLINLVAQTFGNQKTFSYHSIITKTGDLQCKNTNGATYGTRYESISKLTGGYIGSVCETDYGAQLVGIANGVRDMLKVITLQCSPLLDRGFTIEIQKNGQAFSQSFRLEGLNLVFNEILQPGDYQIKYSCLK